MRTAFLRTGFMLVTVVTVSAYGQPAAPLTQPHEQLHAVLWMQKAGEYRATALQAFLFARMNLDRALQDPPAWNPAHTVAPEVTASGGCVVPAVVTKENAVIVDIDETILDNSRAQASLIYQDGHKFDSKLWDAWVGQAEADAIDGAVEFLQYASARGVHIYYVTNRSDTNGLTAVKKNLTDKGFPVESDDVLLVTGTFGSSAGSTDKSSRRDAVAKKHRVLLLIGDDLGDFFSTSGLKPDVRLTKTTVDYRERWGRQWIMIPNPAYGSWERAFWTSTDKDIVGKKKETLTCIEAVCGKP